MVWSASAGSSPAANLSFRGVDLTENEDVVTFELPDEVRDVTDLVIYDSISNQDTGVGKGGIVCVLTNIPAVCKCISGYMSLSLGVDPLVLGESGYRSLCLKVDPLLLGHPCSWLIGCLTFTSQQHTSVSQGRICYATIVRAATLR